MWTHMGLGRRPGDAWSCGHSQGTGRTREQPGTDPLWGPADTWTSAPSPQNGQMRHFYCLRPPSVVVCVAVKLAHPQETGESLTMNPEVPRHRDAERALMPLGPREGPQPPGPREGPRPPGPRGPGRLVPGGPGPHLPSSGRGWGTGDSVSDGDSDLQRGFQNPLYVLTSYNLVQKDTKGLQNPNQPSPISSTTEPCRRTRRAASFHQKLFTRKKKTG